jgi:hypothetical protein
MNKMMENTVFGDLRQGVAGSRDAMHGVSTMTMHGVSTMTMTMQLTVGISRNTHRTLGGTFGTPETVTEPSAALSGIPETFTEPSAALSELPKASPNPRCDFRTLPPLSPNPRRKRRKEILFGIKKKYLYDIYMNYKKYVHVLFTRTIVNRHVKSLIASNLRFVICNFQFVII